MRGMTEAASEASIGVLHRPNGIDKSLAVHLDVLSEENEGGETPVEEPGPAGVSRGEGGGQLAQLLMQEANMKTAVQMGQSVRVAVVVFLGLEVGQDFLYRLILDVR